MIRADAHIDGRNAYRTGYSVSGPGLYGAQYASLGALVLQWPTHRVQGRSACADFLCRFVGLHFSQRLGEQISHFLERRIGHRDPDRLDIFNRATAQLSRRACHGDQHNSRALADVDSGDEHWSVVGHLILDFRWSQRLKEKFGSN